MRSSLLAGIVRSGSIGDSLYDAESILTDPDSRVLKWQQVIQED